MLEHHPVMAMGQKEMCPEGRRSHESIQARRIAREDAGTQGHNLGTHRPIGKIEVRRY
jgi:hypothetical protein